MFTPQQIADISFKKAAFGGYEMQAVDAFLEPLTQDYVTLYKENALLKSKMRVLVTKLEEYRENEADMKEAMLKTRRTCDEMVREAEAKCAQILRDANRTASENAQNANNAITAEQERIEEARRVASAKISELQIQMNNCIEQLESIKAANRPAISRHTRNRLFDPNAAEAKTGALADEIAHNLAIMIGDNEDADMKVAP